MNRPRPVRISLVLALATLALTAAVASTEPATASVPVASVARADVTTLGGLYRLGNYGALGEGIVQVEPELGRIQVLDHDSWDRNSGIGRFLHVTIGATGATGCEPAYRVVVDKTAAEPAAVYDGSGTRIPVVDRFDTGRMAHDLTRLSIAPMAAVDCYYADTYTGSDPLDPGRRRARHTRVHAFKTVTYGDPTGEWQAGWFPEFDEWPKSVMTGETFEVQLGYRSIFDPYVYYNRGAAAVGPSTIGSMTFAIAPGPDLEVVALPDPMTDIDLWARPEATVTAVLQPATDDLYVAEGAERVTATVDGAAVRIWGPPTLPLRHPAPTDWSGSLAGSRWWNRDYHPEGPFDRIYHFLDDSWVWVDAARSTTWNAPPRNGCTDVSQVEYDGCHRYYYDAATERLQIDGRRIKHEVGTHTWRLPVKARQATREFDDRDEAALLSPGSRLDYRGFDVTKSDRSIVFRDNGRFRLEEPTRSGDRRVTRGRYRVVGDESTGVPRLVLRSHRRIIFSKPFFALYRRFASSDDAYPDGLIAGWIR